MLEVSWRVAVVAATVVLSACSYRSGATYTPDETGRALTVETARVVSSREVSIAGLDNRQAAGWGTTVGAALAGTAAYGITGADNPAGVAITIAAAIVGGLVGLAVEEQRQSHRGVEYILRDEGDETLAIVQALSREEKIYRPGTDVSLIHGSRGYYRVVPVRSSADS